MTDLRDASLAGSFTDDLDAWHKAVAGVFARVQKKDIKDIPVDVWRKLIVTTPDGVDISPLYTRADEHGEPNSELPGVFPFTRGIAVDEEREGWGVCETFGAYNDSPAEVNRQILHALNFGTTAISLDLRSSLTPADLPAVLDGVLTDLTPIHLHAGQCLTEAAHSLLELVDGSAGVTLGAAPLTADVDGSESATLDEALALAAALADRDDVRTLLVDAVSLSNQGASDAQEVGLALAVGVEYVRLLSEAGVSTGDALRQIAFRFAVNDDQFGQIAKLRSARRLWARVCEVLGHPEEAAAPQSVLTAPVMFSQRDAWVNMLRSTVAAFAGGVGGATDVEVLTFDSAIPGGMPGTSRNFAHRIARNTNLLLLEESHLGHVVDPAGGSYYVESFTDELSAKAWSVFTGIEAEGGFQAAVANGSVARALIDMHEKNRHLIATRRKKLTGINEFPNLAEAPLSPQLRHEPAGVRRWAAEFESLRNRSDAFLETTGERPSITLIPLGPLSKHNIRTGFVTNLLAAGGISVVNPGELTPGTADFSNAAAEARIVVVCGTDQEYAASGVEAVEKSREAGAGEILLAGASASFEGASTQPDGYLNMKIDAAEVLSDLLDTLGA